MLAQSCSGTQDTWLKVQPLSKVGDTVAESHGGGWQCQAHCPPNGSFKTPAFWAGCLLKRKPVCCSGQVHGQQWVMWSGQGLTSELSPQPW